ncbi:MAG: hypothetical protein KC776_04060 [Myxococcales bacterium]|nr:hypothetical protein [Myxococcales bacterium]
MLTLAEGAYRDLGAGNLSTVARALSETEASSDGAARAWACALRAKLALIAPRYGTTPSADQLARLAEEAPTAGTALMLALGDAMRMAIVTFDGARLRDLARVVVAHDSPEARVIARLSQGWAALAMGDDEEATSIAGRAAGEASDARLAELRVDAQSLRALACADDAEALTLARQASLMARNEALPQAEFLAHLVLTRARRRARQAHLSLRILEVLRRTATQPWQDWIAWEWLLAGGAPAEVSGPARWLGSALDFAAAGDREGYERAFEQLLEPTAGYHPIAEEVRVLREALEPGHPSHRQELLAWRAGRTPLVPAALDGLRVRAHGEESASAYVLVTEGAARLLHWGVELVQIPGLLRIKQSQRAQGRTETVLSVLALAGNEGLDEAECFRQTYGFSFAPELHRGVFDVLLHRARRTLGDAATIDKDDGRLLLRHGRPLLIPDPRVSQRVTDQLLRVLAQKGTASAKNAAHELGISLRAAQTALADLVAQGACDTRKEGRAVTYVVEDTVFSEPTDKLRAQDLTGLTQGTQA